MAENEKSSRFQKNGSEIVNGSRFSPASNPKRRKVNYGGGYEGSGDATAYVLLLGFIVAIIPLITHCKIYNPNLSSFEWFSDTKSYIDVFLYYKQWWFCGTVVIMLICLLVSLANGKLRFEFQKIFVPLWVIAVFSFLSTIISPYREYGFSGIFEQFENVLCLLGYILCVFFVYFYVKKEKDIRLLINILAVGALVIGIIGAFQGIKLDFFRSDFGKSLLATEGVPAENLEFSFEIGRAYVTLYNPNYVGVYCTLLIPLFSVMVAFARNWKERSLYVADVVLLLISMFAAQFKAGIVSLGVVILLSVVLLWRILLKRWYIVLAALALVAGLFIGVDYVNGNVYSTMIAQAFKVEKLPQAPLSDISMQKEGISFVYNGKSYKLTTEGQESLDENGNLSLYSVTAFHLVDEKGTEISGQYDENGAWWFNDDNITNNVHAYQSGSYYWILSVDGNNWNFVNRADGCKYINIYGKETTIEKAQSAIFDGYEGFASKRGYIWEKTIPLLRKYIIFGSGADTFSIAFPQNDYVDAYNAGYGSSLISKPHCWYLQVGVQTGALSMVALIAFYIIYFVQSILLYSKKVYDTYLGQVGVAVFLGTIGYMISGLTNDSSISVAPVFWVVIGIGVSVNIMLKKKLSQAN